MLNWFTNLFPVWVLLGGILALIEPALFVWFRGPAIVWGLAVIMLGMGMTLSVADFKRVLKRPKAVAAGFVAQYTIMPLMGWAVAHLFRLDTPFAVGLILVACCPGGTASNVVTYIARADVALSVLMTTCSTFGAVFMTPLLTKWLAGTYVPVNAWSLFLSTVQVVLAPVIIGLALHHFFPRTVNRLLPIAPLVSVVTIALICASIIGQNAAAIMKSGAVLLLAVFLLHAGGFFLGYVLSRLLRYDRITNRTISIEVGMQNSGLGVALAQKNFPALPTAAVPCAISSVFHSVIGSILAGIWRLRTTPAESPIPLQEEAPGILKRRWALRGLVALLACGVITFLLLRRAEPPPVVVLPPDAPLKPSQPMPAIWDGLLRLRSAVFGYPKSYALQTTMLEVGTNAHRSLAQFGLPAPACQTNEAKFWYLPTNTLSEIKKHFEQHADIRASPMITTSRGRLTRMFTGQTMPINGIQTEIGWQFECVAISHEAATDLAMRLVTSSLGLANTPTNLSVVTNIALAARLRIPHKHGALLLHQKDTNAMAMLIVGEWKDSNRK